MEYNSIYKKIISLSSPVLSSGGVLSPPALGSLRAAPATSRRHAVALSAPLAREPRDYRRRPGSLGGAKPGGGRRRGFFCCPDPTLGNTGLGFFGFFLVLDQGGRTPSISKGATVCSPLALTAFA